MINKFHTVVGANCPHKSAMTSLVAFGRLQYAIKFWTKVMRKTDPAGQRVKYFGHCLTQIHKILHDIRADIVYSHTGYDVTRNFRSAFIEVRKTAQNAAFDGFGSKFSGAAFCLLHQLVGFLLLFTTSDTAPPGVKKL